MINRRQIIPRLDHVARGFDIEIFIAMIRWDAIKLVAQDNKTKNQPQEYKLFFSCFAEIIMKKSGHRKCGKIKPEILEKTFLQRGYFASLYT